MNKLLQLHTLENPIEDCFRTVLACILDYPKAEDVPNFSEGIAGHSDAENKMFFDRANDWLRSNHSLGLHYRGWNADRFVSIGHYFDHLGIIHEPWQWVIAHGWSARDNNHVCIARNGRHVWDPASGGKAQPGRPLSLP